MTAYGERRVPDGRRPCGGARAAVEQEGASMSATDELRRLLDERGVEYEVQREGTPSEAVVWDGPIGTRHSAFVSCKNADRRIGDVLYATLFLTPEQAVEATLGRGEFHAVEDVLLEACKAYHGLMTESMSDVAHDMSAPSEIIAEYAAKLRLAGDAK